jgi:hypothetical protein
MNHRIVPLCLLLAGIAVASVLGLAQDAPTEAPAGFDTPTLVQNPGSQSQSNGIAEPPGDTYALDQQIYEEGNDPSTGLGPVYNARACSDCHQNPVSGEKGEIVVVGGCAKQPPGYVSGGIGDEASATKDRIAGIKGGDTIGKAKR